MRLRLPFLTALLLLTGPLFAQSATSAAMAPAEETDSLAVVSTSGETVLATDTLDGETSSNASETTPPAGNTINRENPNAENLNSESLDAENLGSEDLDSENLYQLGDSTYFSAGTMVSSDQLDIDTTAFHPDSNKSLWFAALCPGLGQLYNRRYWKLPIVAGGFVGVAYAISWNNRYYEAYTDAYRDLLDDDPNTKYYEELLHNSSYSTSQLQTTLKNRQLKFRRQRDLSIIVGVAVYLVCILDAYVDAELFDFDISDDLSLQLAPASSPAYMPVRADWSAPGEAWVSSDPFQRLGMSFCFRF